MFDFEKVEVTEYDTIPQDWYPAFVEKVEWKTSKAGADYLNLQWKVIGEKQANRVVFDALHLFNANEVAKRIALETVKKILIANNVEESKMNFSSKEELQAALFSARNDIFVKVRKQDGYSDQNVVAGYRELSGEVVATDITSSDIPF